MCNGYRLCEKIHHDREQLTCDLMMVSAEKGNMKSLLDVENRQLQMVNVGCMQHNCLDEEVCVDMKIGDHTCHGIALPPPETFLSHEGKYLDRSECLCVALFVYNNFLSFILDLCPSEEWVPFNRKCFYFDSARSLDANVELCEGMNAKLVRADNEEVNSFLRSEVSRRGLTYVWIGANDKDVEGEWVWGHGDPASFTDWRDGDPDNWGNEDCAIISIQGWHDVSCSSTFPISTCQTSYNISTLST
ncbi:uncharacterized protein [Argopecten irradians]|uniref:uncharacterized protein n=1 Tax=Argopecten irradians TaxID=31199 RepID=UPI003715914D